MAACTDGFGDCDGIACNADYRDCNGNANDGCETHITDDVNNCGSCGNRCYFGFACAHET